MKTASRVHQLLSPRRSILIKSPRNLRDRSAPRQSDDFGGHPRPRADGRSGAMLLLSYCSANKHQTNNVALVRMLMISAESSDNLKRPAEALPPGGVLHYLMLR